MANLTKFFKKHRFVLNCVRDCSGNPGVASLLINMFDRLPRSARNDGLQRKAGPEGKRPKLNLTFIAYFCKNLKYELFIR
ncbi:MAG TPA: hypothetical protein VLM44_08785 [Lutibacter sp.]|nr:hypothetical protein [Lutibacter sp.]